MFHYYSWKLNILKTYDIVKQFANTFSIIYVITLNMLIAESFSSIENQLPHKNQPAQMNMSITYGHIGDQISNKQRSYPPWVQNTHAY